MPDAHVANVAQMLGGNSSLDRYVPKCRCGWRGEPITAGDAQNANWQAAWTEADAHVLEALA